MKVYEYQKKITAEQVEDIMDSALRGITYWADEAYVVGDYDGWTSKALTAGKRIRIHDKEENKWHVLTMKKFLDGLSISSSFDDEYFDSSDADSIIQNALFGKVIYG